MKEPVGRTKILFVSEAITLAQLVRLVTLARTLDPRRYEVHFAAATFPERIFRPGEFQRWSLFTLDGAKALRRLDRGGRIYDRRTLQRYLAADREVIRQVRPALVVGDLRWSLALSAPLENVPFAVLANAYMSPHARRDGFPLPDHPIVRVLGERLAARYFPRALPAVFDWFARPLNRLREAHGLPSIGSLLEVLTFGDLTLYAEPPGLIAMESLPPHHRFIGHVEWSPADPVPAEWARDPARYPIYVTLGSSGDVSLLPKILVGIADLPVDVLVATAGRGRGASGFPMASAPAGSRARVHVTSFVSGAHAAKRARLVISNGGSTTGYQALAASCPVLGLPHNLEQHLAMAAITTAGAGRSISARHARPAAIGTAVLEMLDNRVLAAAAARVGSQLAAHDPAVEFPRIVDQFMAGARSTRQGA